MCLLLQLAHAGHHFTTFFRLCAEHLQEGAGVQGVGGLDGEGIGTVGNIGHRLHALRPEAVHFLLQRSHLVFVGRGVAQFVDLVDEARHPGPLAEEAFHIGELYVAVGVHKARAQDARIHLFGGGAQPGTHHGPVFVYLYKSVLQRFTGKGVNGIGCKNHKLSTGGKSKVSRSFMLMESTVYRYTLSLSKRTCRVSTWRTRGRGRRVVSTFIL